jgi:signal transduction histidine kinase
MANSIDASDICSANMADEALHQSVRLEVLQELAASIGADLTNIFTVISGTLQLQIMELGGDPAAYRWTQNAIHTAARGAQLASGLLEFAGSVTQPKRIDLRLMLTEQLPTLRAILGATATFDNRHKEKLWQVTALAAPIAAALRTLAQHALMTMPPGGAFAVTARNLSGTDSAAAELPSLSHRGCVSLTVAYPGDGLSSDEVRSVMMPGFMVKPSAERPSLNLSTAAATLRRCGGSLTVESPQGRGIYVRLLLPRAKRQKQDWFSHHRTADT